MLFEHRCRTCPARLPLDVRPERWPGWPARCDDCGRHVALWRASAGPDRDLCRRCAAAAGRPPAVPRLCGHCGRHVVLYKSPAPPPRPAADGVFAPPGRAAL